MNPLTRALSLGACLGLLIVAASAVPSRAEDEAKPAKIIIKVPDKEETSSDRGDLKLTVNGKATKGSGTERVFMTPPLKGNTKEKYFYTFKAEWPLANNNYETIVRTRKVYVKPGDTVTVDFTKHDPKTDTIVIIYVPTPPEFVDEMMKLAKVGKDDVVYDLGCGDGRIVIAAVSKYGAKKGVGVDLDPERLAECKKNAEEAKVTDKVEFRKGDVMRVPDLEKATVVTLYLSDELNGQLWPILQEKCKPGTRIVSHRFKIGNDDKVKPEKSVPVESKGYKQEVHLWTVKGKKEDDKDDKKKGRRRQEEEKGRRRQEEEGRRRQEQGQGQGSGQEGA